MAYGATALSPATLPDSQPANVCSAPRRGPALLRLPESSNLNFKSVSPLKVIGLRPDIYRLRPA